MNEKQIAELVALVHAATHSDDHDPIECDNSVCKAAGGVLEQADSPVERIADDNGDELERGAPDFPGQFASGEDPLREIDTVASQVHDDLWAEPYDEARRKLASDGIWRIHQIVRPLIASETPSGEEGT